MLIPSYDGGHAPMPPHLGYATECLYILDRMKILSINHIFATTLPSHILSDDTVTGNLPSSFLTGKNNSNCYIAYRCTVTILKSNLVLYLLVMLFLLTRTLRFNCDEPGLGLGLGLSSRKNMF